MCRFVEVLEKIKSSSVESVANKEFSDFNKYMHIPDTFGTGKVSNEKLVEIVRENFDLRPAGIIKMLDLRRPIYRPTAAYGHFGRDDVSLPWEAVDKAEMLKKYF